MQIVKLDVTHRDITQELFAVTKSQFYHVFEETYMSGLKNHHAYGMIDNNKLVGLISFYESIDDASWYGTHMRNSGDKKVIEMLLDRVIQHNEERGRFKFYTLWPANQTKILRRFAFSDWAKNRYDYFDEFMVPAKHQCKFTLPWQILYGRTLISHDTVLRCTFLKQEFRTELFNAGGL